MSNKKPDTMQDDWGFFTQVPDIFIEESKALTNQARWLFVLLRFHTNKKSKNAFPSYELLKEETGWSDKTISKAIKNLEKYGWLTRKKGFGENTQYRLVRNDSTSQREGMAANDSTSQRQVQYFPTASPVLPNGKDITYTELTETERTYIEHEDLNYSKTHNLRRDSAQPPVIPPTISQTFPCNIPPGERTPPPVHNEIDQQLNGTFPGTDTDSPQGSLFAQNGPLLDSRSNDTREGVKIQPTPVSAQKRPISAKGKTRQKVSEPVDPRATHPAIVAIRDLRCSFPPKPVWGKLIDLIGVEIDKLKLESCWVEWLMRGYNKNSLEWVKWYVVGIPEPSAGKPKKTERKWNGETFDFAAAARVRRVPKAND